MKTTELMKSFEESYKRKEPLLFVGKTQVEDSELKIGDTVRVHQKIVEGNKERVQVFQGVLIKKQNTGINQAITVRKISFQIGVEKQFLLNSPRVVKVEILRHGVVRRSRLYYLRHKTGKQSRIKEKIVTTQEKA